VTDKGLGFLSWATVSDIEKEKSGTGCQAKPLAVELAIPETQPLKARRSQRDGFLPLVFAV
jgi:hypothetical protein